MPGRVVIWSPCARLSPAGAPEAVPRTYSTSATPDVNSTATNTWNGEPI